MPDFVHTGVTNIALIGDTITVTCREVTPPPDPFPVTDEVNSLAELCSALNDGAPDIILMKSVYVTKSGPQIVANRRHATILRAAPGVTISGSGEDFHLISAGPGTGGSMTFIGLTLDGGLRRHWGESPGDEAGNFFIPGLDVAVFEGGTTMYSRRTGIYAEAVGYLVIRNMSCYCTTRDFVWCDDAHKVLVEGCTVTHCGDDSIGWHVSGGKTGAGRSGIFRNNRIFGGLGIKVLGPNIEIYGNQLVACGFYGIRLGADAPEGSSAPIENINVHDNIITDIQITNPCHAGQEMGYWMWLEYPKKLVTGPVSFTNNTLVRTNSKGMMRQIYPWAQDGAFSKSGWVPNWTVDVGSEAFRWVCGTPKPVFNNKLVGF
ncbi:Right handed beta helix region [uncultured Caudovirales phage]|uniref:Right handed beta helix region n=1 Tax=uncultured Caudovirales phage TaxID=2100421 RepID=A0A6J5R731_9CAUD|nr:Right handed beta helix region [uncultured Caudovirales phage]